MSLIGYSKRTMTELRRVKAELAEVQYNLGQVQSLASEEHAKAVTLEQEVERLRPMESALRSFQERKPEIEHYLRTIPKLAE
jgi:predicted RNA-binding protein with EMAP domain